MSKPNISPEIEAALAEGREAGLREAAEYLRGLKQRFVPWFVRGMGDVPETDAEGWGDMKPSEIALMQGAARGVLRLIEHEDLPAVPSHEHIWSTGYSPVCAICGERAYSAVKVWQSFSKAA